MMIRSIIFDIGNVLVNYSWRNYLNQFGFNSEQYNTVANAMFLSDTWNEFDRSLLSDEDILKQFIKNAPAFEADIRKVFDGVGGVISGYDYALPWIRDLKQNGYRVYVLSNYAEKTFVQSKKEMLFLDIIDGGIISFQVKRVKPEPEIYLALMEKYDIIPGEAVFLDDMEKNIAAADALGFYTIHFTGYLKAVEELKKIGVKVGGECCEAVSDY